MASAATQPKTQPEATNRRGRLGSDAKRGQGTVIFQGVTKRFGPTVAVDNVDLTVEGGSYVVLLGPSGCGKTTLLRMIGGHESLDEGEFFLDSARINDVPAAHRDISTVFQHYALFPHKSVLDNVEFGLKMRRIAGPERRQRALDAVEFMDLGALADRKPVQLSGGQQQRVALARALVIEPTVLLLDEPLGDLDRLLQLRMRVELRALQRRLKITFIHVTHNQEEALAIADQIVVMQDGQIKQIGSPRNVYRHPANLFTSSFMGDNNIFSGQVTSLDGDAAVIETTGLSLLGRHAPNGVAVGQPVHASVRANSLKFRRANHGDNALSANEVQGRLTFIEYLGDIVKLHCRLPSEQTVVAKTPERDSAWESIAEGDDLVLFWDAADVQILSS